MTKYQNINNSTGFILIHKTAGPTSHDIIDNLRKITDIKKIGHAGTLDPFASGLLLVAIGRQATKKIDQFVKKNKTYIATLKLGAITDTYDRKGVKTEKDCIKPDEEKIKKVLSNFIGEQEQIPPMFSAKKIKGKKLYELARKGIEIERKPSTINIYNIKFLKYSWPVLEIEVHCSTGTYIRSLANDIGKKLNCGAYLEDLERTKIGDFDIKKAYKIDHLTKDNWEKFLFQIDD